MEVILVMLQQIIGHRCLFKRWEHELDRIYVMLEKKLPQSEVSVLKEEQKKRKLQRCVMQRQNNCLTFALQKDQARLDMTGQSVNKAVKKHID